MSEQVTQDSHPQPKAAKDLLSRGRILLVVGLLGVELAIFFTAMTIPLDAATQQDLLNQANNLLGTTKNPSQFDVFVIIMRNNLRVALAEMVPVLGALLLVFSIFTTGQVIQAVATSTGLPGALYGVFLFFFPFAIVELAAYATAVGSGTMLIVAWGRHHLRREVRVIALEGVAVVAMLVVAAAMEVATIVSPVLGFAMWAPTALGIVLLVMFARRRTT